ncbi:MAG: thiol peroxidase [Nitrospina sp.]|nr:thiol peroxidase [Nitrospina sp.]
MLHRIGFVLLGLLFFPGSSWADSIVSLRGKPMTLRGETLQVGQTLPSVRLPDRGMNRIDLQSLKGNVTLVSVVPSLDTPTCDKQTHILSEENKGLDQVAKLITISRDLPFAQKRFAKEAKINNVIFLSDYRDAGFGEATGLLIDENRLLTRAIIVLDRARVIRYLEVVSELARLPDMEKAFAMTWSLINKGN